MEFENVLGEKTKGYILQKKIDGDFWYEGNFRSIQSLANAILELGKQGYEEVNVKEIVNG